MSTTETITWYATSERMPDADATVLPLLRTDQLVAAMRRVDLVMQRMEAQA